MHSNSNPKLTHGNESGVEPRIVFFSGGSALKKTSQLLSTINKKSVHIITTFDSGGSSGFLRQAFSIPAVGDLRNRLLALANRATIPVSMIDFMNFRLPAISDQNQLIIQFQFFCKKNNELWQKLPPDIFREFASLVDQIVPYIPKHFIYTNLCIGNLLMTSYYLYNSNKNLYKTVEYFSNLFSINGIILPVSETNLHIGARLQNNSLLIGQHRLKNYGKYIDTVFLTPDEPIYGEITSNEYNIQNNTVNKIIPKIDDTIANLIKNADIICYPMGSFYSSLISNLIPSGLFECIRNSQCKKVFIPNTGYDPELDNKTIADQVKIILKTLSCDLQYLPMTQIISTILLDLKNGKYNFASDNELNTFSKSGIEIIDSDICTNTVPSTHNPENIIKQLYELVSNK